MDYTQEQNRALCREYPFLDPNRRWDDTDFSEDAGSRTEPQKENPDRDYSFTALDEMPDGWRIAFGKQLCDELKAELERAGRLKSYQILQIKEKYGALRWYDYGNTKAGYEILAKYEDISARTCICCGKPATRITRGWISPYCDDCCPDEASDPIEESEYRLKLFT